MSKCNSISLIKLQVWMLLFYFSCNLFRTCWIWKCLLELIHPKKIYLKLLFPNAVLNLENLWFMKFQHMRTSFRIMGNAVGDIVYFHSYYIIFLTIRIHFSPPPLFLSEYNFQHKQCMCADVQTYPRIILNPFRASVTYDF